MDTVDIVGLLVPITYFVFLATEKIWPARTFQHWNVRTPQWLGYLIQRPESHCVHHRLGVHYYNYADLPLWDILFGTFRNPKEFRGECGFESPHDRRIGAMLGFTDVNAALYGAGNVGVKPISQAPG